MDDKLAGSFYADASHFANDSNSAYEVQRTNHFEVVINLDKLSFAGQAGGTMAQHLRMSTKSIQAPKITAESQTIKHGNDTVKVASAPTFDDLQLVVYDTLGVDQIDLLQRWFNCVFNRTNKLMGLVKDYKTDGILYMYSPDCKIIRRWELQGIWPKEFGVGSEFSFDSAELQTVQVMLSVDRYFEAQD